MMQPAPPGPAGPEHPSPFAWSTRRSSQAAAQAADVALVLEEAEPGAGARLPVEHVVVEVRDRLQLLDEYNPDALRGTVTVAQDGKIPLPDAGWVFVAGMTREEVEQELTRVLSRYFVQSEVRVIVKKPAEELRSLLFEAF